MMVVLLVEVAPTGKKYLYNKRVIVYRPRDGQRRSVRLPSQELVYAPWKIQIAKGANVEEGRYQTPYGTKFKSARPSDYCCTVDSTILLDFFKLIHSKLAGKRQHKRRRRRLSKKTSCCCRRTWAFLITLDRYANRNRRIA